MQSQKYFPNKKRKILVLRYFYKRRKNLNRLFLSCYFYYLTCEFILIHPSLSHLFLFNKKINRVITPRVL